MTHTTHDRDGGRAEDHPLPDGGHAASRSAMWRVADRTTKNPANEIPRLGDADGDDHPFDPVELSRGSLALPVVAAIAVGIATQSSVVIGTGAAAAWLGSLAVPVVAVLGVIAGLKLL